MTMDDENRLLHLHNALLLARIKKNERIAREKLEPALRRVKTETRTVAADPALPAAASAASNQTRLPE